MGLAVGLVIVSVLTIVATLAFFGQSLPRLVRNIVITDLIFTALYIAWLNANKGYEGIYKAGLSIEDKK